MHAELLCCVSFATPWTVACQTPLSMEFSRQEYWSRQPFHSPEDLLNPRIKLGSPALQADFFFLYCLSHQGSPFIRHIVDKVDSYPSCSNHT